MAAPALPSMVFWNALPVFWLSDADAIKTMSADRLHFPEDVEAVSFILSLIVKRTEARAV
jgi:hypothetical protein